MFDGLAAFALTSLVIELTPGPNMAYLALIAATEGRKAGFAALAGVALGLSVMGIAAALGLAAVIQSVPLAYQVLHWLGVLYLLYLCWEGWVGASDQEGPTPPGATLWRFFGRGLVTNLLNPKAAIFYVTVLPGFVLAGPNLAQSLTLTLVYVAIATGIHAVLVAAAATAHGWLSQPERVLWVRRGLSVMLLALVVWMVIKG